MKQTKLTGMISLAALMMTLLVTSSSAVAQESKTAERSTPLLVAAGLGAGFLGAGLGGGLGMLAGFASECEDDPGRCVGGGVSGLVIGAAVGEALSLPIGVHLANRRRGPLSLELIASLGIAAAGVAILSAVPDDSPATAPIIISIPVGQLLFTIRQERRR